jgi:hypothetical protein
MWFFLTYNNSKTHLQLHFIMFNWAQVQKIE